MNKRMERRIVFFFLIKSTCTCLYADKKEPTKRKRLKIEEKENLLMKQDHSRAKRK